MYPSSRPPGTLTVASSAFEPGAAIPREFTCEGRNVSPPLSFRGIPASTRGLALIVDDPDAPGGTFTHWLFWNLPPEVDTLEAGADAAADGAVVGVNDFGARGYGGPCPPSGTHRYRFHAYAQTELLDLPDAATAEDLRDALDGATLVWGELEGTFAKSREARAAGRR